jgi:CheY-like chemotaxis protein
VTSPIVLVVDPDVDARNILATFLRHSGYEVAEAGTAAEGLDAARRLAPRMIVGEHPLMLEDGTLLCEVLKGDPVTADIPFLAITSRVTRREWKSAERSHYRVMAKPLQLASVLEAIGAALEGGEP